MIKKIKILSNIFIKDYFQNLYIFNKDTKKVNKKSGAVWLAIISALTIGLLSYKIIDFLGQTRQEILFLKIYLPILYYLADLLRQQPSQKVSTPKKTTFQRIVFYLVL